eukprot:CAMPEP_0171002528 /NCGR_PEP_ID=MMETSP0736-20130129/16259_1 /TAXON_ID=186038 /ORGANISM="Fragilariopsis kerguelensis, Strain L26-C5" /LENGTH=250 /DNA_ID=CAMNT_0011430927 /DNA_START=21 /DNA_END=770 /DNA_ORIENTATION=-
MNSVIMMSFSSKRNSHRNHIRRSMKKNEKHFDDHDDDSSTMKTDTDLDASDHSTNSSQLTDEEVHTACVIKVEDETETPMKTKTKKKGVRFSTVNIRQYSICLGDHPSVALGAPISLDWTYEKEISIDLQEYEQHTTQYYSGKRRTRCEFKLPSQERFQLFKQLGYSRNEIQEAIHEVTKIKIQRLQTRQQYERKDFMRSFFFQGTSTKAKNSNNNDTTTKASPELPLPLLRRNSLKLPKKKKSNKNSIW